MSDGERNDHAALEPPAQATYPMFADRDAESRRRWDYCVAVAALVLGEDTSAGQRWTAASVMFHDPAYVVD
ncbi:MAG: hypothetical protein WKF96_21340 [Solirubrobacteraceae bacterium]